MIRPYIGDDPEGRFDHVCFRDTLQVGIERHALDHNRFNVKVRCFFDKAYLFLNPRRPFPGNSLLVAIGIDQDGLIPGGFRKRPDASFSEPGGK